MAVGVQTFTIRKAQKQNPEKAYLPLVQMGIRELEIARIRFHARNAELIRSLAERYQIRVAAIQVKPGKVAGQTEKIISFCKTTGCRNVVISMLPFSCILGREERFYEFLETLDPLYERYRAQGIELAYHHHNWEYIRLSNGKTRMEELLEQTSKIKFVHDTYWTTRCGLSSPEQIRQFGNRLLGVHLRDLTLVQKGLKVLAKDAAVGTGVVDFEAVFQACAQTGCEYTVIEQKTKHPYEEIARSYQNCMQIQGRIGAKRDEGQK